MTLTSPTLPSENAMKEVTDQAAEAKLAGYDAALSAPKVVPSDQLALDGWERTGIQDKDRTLPSLFGVPLKYISLFTLAVQNAALTIIMHTSRTTIPPSQQYSAASAVLINEILKCSLSFIIALYRVQPRNNATPYYSYHPPSPRPAFAPSSQITLYARVRQLTYDIFSPDAYKLSIPAILYVFQNNLQYTAATNLDAATFQVTYQMKILTTAAFSVILLRKQLSPLKWAALIFLALGVGIVQLQSSHTGGSGKSSEAGHMHHSPHNPLVGFIAVTAACFTSGLAGVYFEMVLKNSQADLWVRNVQLSLFSFIPAFLPVLISIRQSSGSGLSLYSPRLLFQNFGFWAWATVLIQVLGGLITAVVIKHADNILKGFATSLSIVFSFIASVALFDFQVTPGFVIGASIVLGSTWVYNQPKVLDSSRNKKEPSHPHLHLDRAATPTSITNKPPIPSISLPIPRRISSSDILSHNDPLADLDSSHPPILGNLPFPTSSPMPSYSGRRSLGNSRSSSPTGGLQKSSSGLLVSALGIGMSMTLNSLSRSPSPQAQAQAPQIIQHPIYTPPPSRPLSRNRDASMVG